MPGFRLITGNRLERLADLLCDSVAAAPLPALTPEVIVVQSMGMQRWLSMRMAQRLGVCANTEFPFPNALVERLFRDFLPNTPGTADFTRSALAWRVMKLLPGMLGLPAFSDLATYLAGSQSDVKLLQLSQRIADLFDQYTIFRPDLVLAWQQGRPGEPGDDRDAAWQAHLFRALASSTTDVNRSVLRRRLFDAMAAAAALPEGLPRRIAVFGVSYMPRFHLEALAGLARLCDVTMYSLNPCRELWDYIAAQREQERRTAAEGKPLQEASRLHLEEGNSLLAALGQHGRDFFRVLHEIEPVEAAEQFDDVGGGNMLACVQQDILRLRNPDQPVALKPGDRSIRFCSCHSRMREVEALRDHLLEMLDADPGLACRDIVVMAPDIGPYVPLVRAAFDTGDRLPYSIADRSLAQAQVVSEFMLLLDMEHTRFSAPSVLRLLECESVQRRFAISRDDLSTIRDWVERLAVRWGLNAADRASLGLPPFAEHTWQAAMDRLLLGIALDEGDALFAGVLPSAGAAAAPAAADRFLRFHAALRQTVSSLRTPRTPGAWADTLCDALTRLFDFGEEQQADAQQVRLALGEAAGLSQRSGFAGELSCAAMRELLQRRLGSLGSQRGYLSGGVTFCSLLPMRSIPFRVICLLGMNHGDFPRRQTRASFDLMARRPRPGDRSARLDDRYLFLEALLSARDALYVSYVGQDAHDNSRSPPSVCVMELRQYLGRRFVDPRPRSAGDAQRFMTVEHRLQPFHSAYFSGEDPLLFSYDTAQLRAAQLVARSRPRSARAFVSGRFDAETPAAVSLDELVSFYMNPARHALQGSLGMAIPQAPLVADDSEPFALEGLERYQVAEYLAAAATGEQPVEELRSVAAARGLLPHGTPGSLAFSRLAADVGRFRDTLAACRQSPQQSTVDLSVHAAGMAVSGRLRLWGGERIVSGRYATIKARDLVRSWLGLLLLSASGRRGDACLVGRDASDAIVRRRFSQPGDPSGLLSHLVEQYLRGRHEVLPFFPETSAAFAQALADSQSPEQAYARALEAWQGGHGRDGECDDPWVRQCYDGALPRGELFESLSTAFYAPLFEAETGA